jgi:two-component system NtrC family sensor kinase
MDAQRAASPTTPSPWRLVAWMVSAIVIVIGLAWWDDQREADAALRDLETQQTVVASSLAASLRAHLALIERDAIRMNDRTASQLIGVEPQAEHPGDLTILSFPGDRSLYATDGRILTSPLLRSALDGNASVLRLERSQAARVGLPARMAMAGLAHVDAGGGGQWGIAAVTSVARERDREKRALGRLVLSIVVTSGLVLAFGGLALRKQRAALELARELAVAEVQRSGEETLAQAQRVATMGTFAMGIAHEVSTPLGVIVGRSEQLLGRVKGDERSEHGAQTILKQADRIQQIVRRFLDMARGGPPSLERTDPSELARAAAGAVEHRFVKAQIALATDIPSTMPPIQCDRALLEQALVNLLLNACDACRPGEQVELAARAGADRIAFVVTDDGVGITTEHAARATQPFFTTKAERGGSGLGLAIATEIAKSHRGDLTIGPNTPRGTRACIEIPIATQRGPEARYGVA